MLGLMVSCTADILDPDGPILEGPIFKAHPGSYNVDAGNAKGLTSIQVKWEKGDTIFGFWSYERRIFQCGIIDVAADGTATVQMADRDMKLMPGTEYAFIYAPGYKLGDLEYEKGRRVKLKANVTSQSSTKRHDIMTGIGTIVGNDFKVSFEPSLSLLRIEKPAFEFLRMRIPIKEYEVTGKGIYSDACIAFDLSTNSWKVNPEGKSNPKIKYTVEDCCSSEDDGVIDKDINLLFVPSPESSDINIRTRWTSNDKCSAWLDVNKRFFNSGNAYVSISPIIDTDLTLNKIRSDEFKREWMAYLPDDWTLKDLSILGTHDSTTGVYISGAIAKTQDLTLPNQYNAGVRYFDLRVQVRSTGDPTDPWCAHGDQETMRFVPAFNEIRHKVQGSYDFVLVVLKPENGIVHNSTNGRFTRYVPEIINREIGNNAPVLTDWNMDTPIKKLRGKMLLIYKGGDFSPTYLKQGAYCYGHKTVPEGHTKPDEYFEWEGADFEFPGENKSIMGSYVEQDFYVYRHDELPRKRNEIERMMEVGSKKLPEGVFVINQVSGYYTGDLLSYRYTARLVNPHASKYLMYQKGNVGIIQADFVGVKTSQIWQVRGDMLANATIEHNYFHDHPELYTNYTEIRENNYDE